MSEWKHQEREGKERKRRDLVADFENVKVHSEQLKILFKVPIWIQQVWSGTWDCEFLASSQMSLMLLIRGLQFKQRGGKEQPKEGLGGVIASRVCVALDLGDLQTRKGVFNFTPLFLILRAKLVSRESGRYLCDFLIQWFSNLNLHRNHLVGLLSSPEPTHRVSESVGLRQRRDSCVSSRFPGDAGPSRDFEDDCFNLFILENVTGGPERRSDFTFRYRASEGQILAPISVTL